jgi:peptide-methionine (S)-S-oxide reductase
VPLNVFYPAEDYHQDYFAKNPGQGYCVAVINPKLQKLREHHAGRLRAAV